jgi:mycothiol synthase
LKDDAVPITSRQYQDEQDYARMRRLLTEIFRLGGAPVYCTLGDLDWWRGLEDDPNAVAKARLWLDSNENVVGFAWPAKEQVDILSHPGYREVEGDMLAWAEEQRRATLNGDTGDAATLTMWAYTQDGGRNALAQKRGYEWSREYFSFQYAHLNRVATEPHVPEGYTLRHVEGEADLEQRVAVHRDAFAPSRMTVDKYRRVTQFPTYRPQLDVVAVAPDGTFAAFCIAWYDEANKIAMFEPVGCHSGHRRRGLATAVMREGMRRLRALGAERVYVNRWGSSAANRQFYESLGFREIGRNYAWKKRV